MLEIAPFKKRQISELKELKRLCEIETGWSPPQEYLDEWVKVVLGINNQDPYLVKVALVGQKIVGYCIAVKRLHSYDGVVLDITWNSAYIWDLFVLKEHRNKGVGTALISDAIAYLKSIGIDKVGVLVNYWNDHAKRLFKKLGFKLWSHFLVKRLQENKP
jgi:ribosomal protein S18 acetylase RimI-like enzyme